MDELRALRYFSKVVETSSFTKAAKVFGLSESYLYKTWKDNPAALRAGRALRWDIHKLRAWMREQAQAD